MRFFNKRDLIVVMILLVIAGIIFVAYSSVGNDGGKEAEIYYGSDLVMTVELDDGEDKIFSLHEHPHVIFHKHGDGTISFESSDCPDQVCVNAGKQGIVGQSAACLPNGLILQIVPDDGEYEEYDIVL